MKTPTNKTHDSHLEDLSAFMDGEMAADSSVFFVSRMGNEAMLEQKWTRYHLIRDVICKQDALLADSKFCDCVRQQYQLPEQLLLEPRTNRWLKPVVGLAMTAAVAFVAVSSVIQLPGNAVGPAVDHNALVGSASVETKNFVTPEIPVITTAGSAAVPVSMTSDNLATAMYPVVNQAPHKNNLAEYLFRLQAKDGLGRSVLLLQRPGQQSAIIFIAPTAGQHTNSAQP